MYDLTITPEQCGNGPLTESTGHLVFWPRMPGRGGYVRPALKEAGVEYMDTPGGTNEVVELTKPTFDFVGMQRRLLHPAVD